MFTVLAKRYQRPRSGDAAHRDQAFSDKLGQFLVLPYSGHGHQVVVPGDAVDFRDAVQALQESRDAQLLWADPTLGREGSHEDVIASMEFTGPLDGLKSLGIMLVATSATGAILNLIL